MAMIPAIAMFHFYKGPLMTLSDMKIGTRL